MAGVILAEGDYAGAEALFREALAMRRKLAMVIAKSAIMEKTELLVGVQ